VIQVAQSSRFLRALKKLLAKSPDLEKQYRERLTLFIADPHNASLKTHKLHGTLEGMQAFSLTWDLRIVFCFKDDTNVVFEDIGRHDEVY
jgi:addiction module RelE/StbE family toxin